MSVNLRARIEARLPKGRIARGILTLASGTALSQAITICTTPIITRLYTPAQFGVLSLFLAFFGFWSATLSLRYEYALLIAKNDAESHIVHYFAVIVVVAMCVLGLPILWGLRHTGVLGFYLLPAWSTLVAVLILLGHGIFMVYRLWALRAGAIKQITRASIARSSANAVTRIVLGMLGGGVAGLFVAEFVGAWSAMLELMHKVRAHFIPSRPLRFTRAEIFSVAKRYMKFATLETPSTWVNQLTLTLPVPMIASLHGGSAAGWFGLARMIGAIPNAQIGRAIGDIFTAELAAAVRTGERARAYSLFRKTLGKLTLLGIAPFVLLGVFSPILAPIILGRDWAEVGWIIAAITPWLYMELIVGPMTGLLFVLQAQEYKLLYDLLSLTTIAGAYFIAQRYNLTLINLIYAIAVARIFSYMIHLTVIVLLARTRLGKRL